MNFKDNKAIYLQIADRIGDDVLSGNLQADARILSVREMAAQIEVNANTVARTYEHLQQCGIIYPTRGLGYIVAPDARDLIVRMRRDQLLHGEMDYFLGQLKAVGITVADLGKIYQEFLDRKKG